jgi:hypothetical protein
MTLPAGSNVYFVLFFLAVTVGLLLSNLKR